MYESCTSIPTGHPRGNAGVCYLFLESLCYVVSVKTEGPGSDPNAASLEGVRVGAKGVQPFSSSTTHIMSLLIMYTNGYEAVSDLVLVQIPNFPVTGKGAHSQMFVLSESWRLEGCFSLKIPIGEEHGRCQR